MEEDEHEAVEILGGRLNSLNLDEEGGPEQKVKCEETNSNNDGDKMVELKARFHSLIVKAKSKSKDGEFEESLRLYKKAYKIHKSEKVLKRIDRLESLLQESDNDDSTVGQDPGYVNVADGFKLSEDIYNKLYAYQKEGVQWFWKLFQQQKGGILGDDMGLGKTIQVITFLCGMFEQEYIKTALIIMPVSLLTNWEKEFKKWAPEIRVRHFHGSNLKQRSDNLAKVQSRNGVCLTTYGLANTCHSLFSKDKYGREFTWDYVILDEGHKIKNTANKTTQAIRGIPASNHFILTGTPIQNNLREMWALFDYVCEGKLLGTSRSFKQEYENPIVRARERDATAYEKRMGQEMSTHLRELIAPHFLRRTKAILEDKPKTSNDQLDGVPPNDEVVDGEESGETKDAKTAKLTRKNDLIIWVYLSETQLQIYKDFLELDRVKEILMTTRSPLAELNVLKKVCDHPRLLSTMACQQLGLSDEQDDSGYNTTAEWCAPPVEQLIQESGKMTFLIELLQKLKQDGHRTLVFSQSTKMLDIIQKVLKEKRLKTIRIDGSVTKIEERESRISAFQTDPSYTVFLLTTQVGGVGLTLTSADRVVIFDPSWNPATDAQAVDRVYRIGQKNTVVIYRLITCGSLEEKIYRKQVFKQAITKQTTGSSNNPYRYFTRHDLRDLFVLDDPKSSKTQIQLEKMHSSSRVTDTKLDEHVAFLYTTDIFGISDHDLLFSQEAVATQEELHAASEMGEAIQAKVRRAADIMKAESSQAPERRGPHLIALTLGAAPKKKNQTKMPDHLEPFIPSREDSKRFMPKKIQPPPPTDVLDLTLMDNEIDEDKLGEQLSAITIDEDKVALSGLATKDPIVLDDSDGDDYDVNRSGNISGASEESLKTTSGEHGVVQHEYLGNTSHWESQPRLAISAHDDSGNDVTSATDVVDDVTIHDKVALESSSEKLELMPVDEGFQENSSEDSIKENTSLESRRSSGRPEMEDSGSDVNHPTHVIDDVITDERDVQEEDSFEKIKMLSVDKDYEEENTSEDSIKEIQASAGKDGLVEINTIDEENHEKRLSEGKRQNNGSTESDDTTDSDAEKERDGVLRPISVATLSPDTRKVSRSGQENDSMYRSNDLDTSQESSEEDDDQDSGSDDGRSRKSERNEKVSSRPISSNNDEVFLERDEQKKEFSKEEYGSPQVIVSDEEEEFYDAKSVSEDVVMDSEEENGNNRDSEEDEEIVDGKDEKVEDTDEENIRDSEDDEVVEGESGIVRDSVNEEIEDSEDDEVVEGEYGTIVDSEGEKTGDSENEAIQLEGRDGVAGEAREVEDEGDERDYHDGAEPDNSHTDDDSDEVETDDSEEMKTSDSEVQSSNADRSESEAKSNDDSVNSQASDEDTEAVVPTKTTRKARQIISDDESEDDDTGKENIPLNSSEKFQKEARKPEEVVQPTTSRSGSKTTCCPRGKHVSDIFDIHSCPCVMSLEAQEAYKMHVNTARRHEKSKEFKLALKHFAEAYKLCDSDVILRRKIHEVYKAVKPRQ